MNAKNKARKRRAKSTSRKIVEQQVQNQNLHRLIVVKTPRHISAQVVVLEDVMSMKTKVIASASTMEKDIKSQCKYTGNIDAAKIVGKAIAERLQSKDPKNALKIAFDRAGYKYHGRVKALADAARETGLDF